MAGKALTPTQIAEALCLRMAGYTITAVADRLHVGIRTLNRLFERNGTKKGAVKAELLEAARQNLIEGVTSNERIREEAACIVADDLAHARMIRSRIADASEHLTAGNLQEAALLMRAAAAYSVALKNTSDTLRHTMRTERALDAQDAQELPELVVREMTDEEVKQMRALQKEEADQTVNSDKLLSTEPEERPLRPDERIVSRK